MPLHEDQYIITPAQDELGRRTLVNLIVNAIKAKVQEPHGTLTFGIYGAWGEGKTTTMRMVEYELRLNRVSCLWFNPWSFSDEKRMVREFFGTLASFTHPDARFWEIIPSYRDAYLHSEDISSDAVLTSYHTTLAKCLPFDGRNLDAIKKEISNRLEKENQHIVVFIDDADRLETEEVQTMFKMIRQVLDFKNVIYVIGVDPDVVALQLGKQYGDNQQARGRDYMEKIINIPIVLPVVQDALLEELIRKEIIGVWRENNLPVDEKEADLVAAALLPVMTTKRAVDRFANQLSFCVPTIGVETEFVDLCLVESLKYLDEKGWMEVYLQKRGLLKEGILFPPGKEREEEGKRVMEDSVSKVLAHYPERWKAYVKGILENHLFAKTHGYPVNQLSRSINDEKYFRQYFIAGIPQETIPRADALVFADLLLQDSPKAIEWIDEKLKSYSTTEVDRSACLALDINRKTDSTVVAAKMVETLAFSGLADNYGYHTVNNPSMTDATIYAYIIPHYMVKRTQEGVRFVDKDKEAEVLTRVFQSAPLNFCMSLFTGIYDNESTRPEKGSSSKLFDIIKERILKKERLAIFDYSYPIKRCFFLEWKATNNVEYTEYWTDILKDDSFDLGGVIKEWLIAVSPQGQLSEIETLAEILRPADNEMKKNLIRSKWKDDKLVRLFVWNCGLFEKSYGDEPIYKNTEELMKNIEISENTIMGANGKRVKITILRTAIPVTNVNAINEMMDLAVSEYVLTSGHSTFVDEHTDTPNYRIVISDFNDIEFKPYDGQHLDLMKQ